MIALSAVDCALWDLKGQVLQAAVWRILGGPTRTEVPAYASDAGATRSRIWAWCASARDGTRSMGYTAQKWFFRHGPMSGDEGLKKNVGAGPDAPRDAGRRLRHHARLLAEHEPRLCRRPLRADRGVPAALARRAVHARPHRQPRQAEGKTSIPLSGAEHEYTRWGFKRFVEKEALDILQPDIYWCGGLSETLKIAAYATVHDLITIPHGHSTPIGIHFSAAQSPIHTPYQEYLMKWNDINMHFLKHPVHPVKGMIRIPDASAPTWRSTPTRSRRRPSRPRRRGCSAERTAGRRRDASRSVRHRAG